MGLKLNFDQLSKTYKSNHPQTTSVAPVLPFITKNVVDLKSGFEELIGEYVRHICGHTIGSKEKQNDELEFDDPLILQLSNKIECQSNAQEDLDRFIRQFLYGTNRSMNVFHPYIYNFLPEPEKDNLSKYTAFVSDVLVAGNPEVTEIFKDKVADDLLSELILENLKIQIADRKEKSKHQCLLPFLSELYREDLLFMSKHKDYFLSHFALLTHFYAFMYLCQLLFKFEMFNKADYSQANPLFFALEWETLSKRRKATEELGFRFIKEKLPNLFVHIHTMTQLSINSSMTEHPFLTYAHLEKQLESADDREGYIASVNMWIEQYLSNFPQSKDGDGGDNSSSYVELEEACRGLFKRVQLGVNQEAAVKYGRNLAGVGGKVFIKSRSSLGQVLNMTQEMLLLLTAVCVKGDRIPLNQLFIEFSRRGVDFDRLSKKAVIELFDALNILDKKSDSGDAQYVKPIL